MKTANSKCRTFVQNRENFEGNNLRGQKFSSGYVVLSYDYYPIHIFFKGKWYETDSSYSVTTAKHISQSRPVTDSKVVAHSEMKKMYENLKYGD